MHHPGLREEFVAAFYYWAQEDFRREIREGFPFLRLIKNQFVVFRQLRAFQSLSQEDQYVLASALVKRFHPRAVRYLGESLTPEETCLSDWYDSAINRWTSEELRLNELETQNPQLFKLNRRRFAALLKEALKPVCGEEIVVFDRSVWHYMTQIGGLTIATFIDVGGQFHQLVYDHAVAPKEDPFFGWGPTSILNWMGLSGGGTYWTMLTEADTAEAAEAAACFCSHFFEGLNSIAHNA